MVFFFLRYPKGKTQNPTDVHKRTFGILQQKKCTTIQCVYVQLEITIIYTIGQMKCAEYFSFWATVPTKIWQNYCQLNDHRPPHHPRQRTENPLEATMTCKIRIFVCDNIFKNPRRHNAFFTTLLGDPNVF